MYPPAPRGWGAPCKLSQVVMHRALLAIVVHCVRARAWHHILLLQSCPPGVPARSYMRSELIPIAEYPAAISTARHITYHSTATINITAS